MLTGFKKFITRGNMVDLAIGVVIGAAFNSVVTSLVKDIVTPLVGAVVHSPDFSKLSFTIYGSVFMLGDFINSFISFILVAAAIYFFVVLPMNALVNRIKRGECVDPTDKSCPECLSKIPIRAKRCAFCTVVQTEE